MTTKIAPLDNRHAVTFNALATGEDNALAERFDSTIRNLINLAGSRKIITIKIFRDFAVCFGAEIGLLEAKVTIDTMMERMIMETYRDLLAARVDSPEWERANDKLTHLDPNHGLGY